MRTHRFGISILFVSFLSLAPLGGLFADDLPATAAPYVLVLGVAQDGGVPQAGSNHPAWQDPSRSHRVVCLALVDPVDGSRWMFECTPDFRGQLHQLDTVAGRTGQGPGLAGIFLTHAHIGHYTGLMFLGHESMGARAVPVFAMPKMSAFLESNGPWSQLVKYGNISLKPLHDGEPVQLNDRLRVTPISVPHRQEYSEVVGFLIEGPKRKVLFIPDIDRWETWDAQGTRIEDLLDRVDVAYLDGTFYANGEIPGRDMSSFPHPFITHTMTRFARLPADRRSRVRFIHFNHTNPVLDPARSERDHVAKKGFRLAVEGERFEL